MEIPLKRLEEQVVVITGATSGIGLVTARMAARRGARLVLAARNEEALRSLAEELGHAAHDAAYVVADVGRIEDVKRIADAARVRFGGFDTWVNNAGVAIYGRIHDVTLDDHRRLFDTNYWGVVHGCMVAMEHLRHTGGAIINIGSVASDRASPLQGPYSASKHAVKGFTEALRMELEKERLPISVTLIKPTAIDTPYEEHAKSYLDVAPKNAPPVYAPELVAEAILRAAERPIRDVYVGGSGKAIATMAKIAPRLTDRMMETAYFALQRTDRPPTRQATNLYTPSVDGRERGHRGNVVHERSAYNSVVAHPVIAALVVTGIGALIASVIAATRT